MDDPDNRKGSWIFNIVKYEDVSPWSEHHRCDGVHVPKMADAMATKMTKKFVRVEDERLSDRDIADGKAPRRTPVKPRLTRELCNMYNQIQRTKDPKPVGREEALPDGLKAAERRKELAEEKLLLAKKSIQRAGTAVSVNEDDSKGGSKSASASASDSSSYTRKSKTPNQIAEEKVARRRKRKGLSDITRIPSERTNRFKSSTADERDTRAASVVEQDRRQRAVETHGKASATKTSRKPKKFAISTNANEDAATTPLPRATKKTKKTKKTIQPPVPVFSESEDEHSEEEVITKRKVAPKSKLQHMNKAEQILLNGGIAQGEQQEREQYAQDEAEPELTQEEKDAIFKAEIEAIERAQLAARKRQFSETGENSSSHISPPSRPIKKAKKNSIAKEVV